MAKIKVGDYVKVIKGRARLQMAKTSESSKLTGVSKVLKVDYEKGKIWLEGLNLAKKHKKPDANNPQGRIVDIEAPMDISNVMLIDLKTEEASRVGFKFLEDGTKVRVLKSGQEI